MDVIREKKVTDSCLTIGGQRHRLLLISNDAVRATAIVNQRLHEVSPHTRNLHQPAAVPKIETDLCLTIDNYRLFPW